MGDRVTLYAESEGVVGCIGMLSAVCQRSPTALREKRVPSENIDGGGTHIQKAFCPPLVTRTSVYARKRLVESDLIHIGNEEDLEEERRTKSEGKKVQSPTNRFDRRILGWICPTVAWCSFGL